MSLRPTRIHGAPVCLRVTTRNIPLPVVRVPVLRVWVDCRFIDFSTGIKKAIKRAHGDAEAGDSGTIRLSCFAASISCSCVDVLMVICHNSLSRMCACAAVESDDEDASPWNYIHAYMLESGLKPLHLFRQIDKDKHMKLNK